jgi:CTP:molybdopterin cytidylyltransferase MocA
MGRPKQLLELNGRPVIKHCLDCIAASGVTDIVVVLGRNGNEVAQAMGSAPAKIAYNISPESEMVESVRAGLGKIDTSASGVLVCLSDHPLVSPDTLRKIVLTHIEDPESIIVPLFKGRKGHPSLFPLSLVREVFSGLNLRDVIAQHADRVHAVDVPDEGVILDMDTPGDYERVRHRFEQPKNGH